MTTKTCTKCRKEKPIHAFGTQAASHDGRRSNCRDCRSKEGWTPGPNAKDPRTEPKAPKIRVAIKNTQEWAMRAACRDMDPDLFEGTGAINAEAVAACADCPVRRTCLEEELQLNPAIAQQFGYRGGTGPAERAQILAERKAAREAAEAAAEVHAA